MTPVSHRYSFSAAVPFTEVEDTLLLSIWGVESLYGETLLRLNPCHRIDRSQRRCVIDTGTPVGRDLNRLFAGYITREFGRQAFEVERVDPKARAGASI